MREVIARAKWTKGRDHTFPFRTRYAWVWEDRRIFTSGGPGGGCGRRWFGYGFTNG